MRRVYAVPTRRRKIIVDAPSAKDAEEYLRETAREPVGYAQPIDLTDREYAELFGVRAAKRWHPGSGPFPAKDYTGQVTEP